MDTSTIIQTGVDKLVALIRDIDRISMKDAAKKLGVSQQSLEEWANFLEEEGVIDIEYKFSKAFLVNKQLTKAEKKKKIKEFKEEKNVFDRRAETAVNYLGELDRELAKISSLFKDMGNHFSSRMAVVDSDIDKLKKAERGKEDLDKQIIEAKKNALNKISEINSHLAKQKHEYGKFRSEAEGEVSKGSEIFNKQSKQILKMKTQSDILKHKLAEVQELSKHLEKQVYGKEDFLASSEKKFAALKEKHEDLKTELGNEHKMMQSLIKENEEKEKEIRGLQQKIFQDMVAGEKKLDKEQQEIKDIPKKFKNFVEKKNQVQDIIKNIIHEELALKEQLSSVIKKGRAMQLSIKSDEYKKQLKALNENIDAIGKKRNYFEGEIKKLVKLIKW